MASAARPGDNTWQRIAYEAKQSVLGNRIHPTRTITYHRQEPTWGDQASLITIVNTLQPNNANTLITAFGLPLQGGKHLQIVRNACFHKNEETLSSVKSISIYYDTLTRLSLFGGKRAVFAPFLLKGLPHISFSALRSGAGVGRAG